ncbi:MAG: SH3 domain-containing protein [Lachnospiraceae bacterium]|nr:SH3 domain-containing protein [Lachnospiraceae bacterium]
MKRRIATIILLAFTATSLVACGNSANVAESTADTVIETEGSITEPTTPEQTEAPHEHVFTETITKEATCLEAGEKTLACECGESSVEEVPATGHDFSNYVSNEDATYEADGTETAKCSNCDETDTRTAEGSMLTYSFEEMDATKYTKSTVNVRSLPNSDGENLGSLSTNDEVRVTGKCNETGWYRIEYSDGIAYVSDEYLVDEKVEAKASAPASSTSNLPTFATYAEVKAHAISLGYPICSAVNNGDGTATTYRISVSDNAGHDESWEHEFEARLADFNTSRDVGEALAGGSIYKEDIVSIVKIAKTAEGYHWTVITERAYCR